MEDNTYKEYEIETIIITENTIFETKGKDIAGLMFINFSTVDCEVNDYPIQAGLSHPLNFFAFGETKKDTTKYVIKFIGAGTNKLFILFKRYK